MLFPISDNTNKNIAIQSVIAPCFSSSDIEKVKRDINVSDWKEMISKDIEVKGKHQLFKNIELFPHLIKIVSNINSQTWRFDINYLNCEIDMPSVLKYEKGGKFEWHRDIEPECSTRKLSFIIQLSDSDEYEGGDVEFFQYTNKEFRKKGNIIVYPSFLWHRVTPVTSGKKLDIVGWMHGPVYR